MKKTLARICIATLILCMTISFPVSAKTFLDNVPTPLSSEYISRSFIEVNREGNGRFAVSFSIRGTGVMTRIGAKSIVISQKEGSHWSQVVSYDQYDSGMSKANSFSYANTIYFDGDIGSEYRFEVTVFAQDSSGSDTESESFILTAV